jgi:signal transduction histidine kinase
MFEKITLNLLGNAVKFTPPGGRIDVALVLSGDAVELSVTDTGPGIPPAMLDAIFERFFQLDASLTRRYEGTGIGLALVKELTELMGGTASVQSTVGKGSRFFVRLPKVEQRRQLPRGAESVEVSTSARHRPDVGRPLSPSAQPRVTAAAWDGPERPRVLVVEDSADMRGYLAEVLGDLYEIQLADDGLAALEQARRCPPEAIVSDIMMPRMDGFELLGRLKDDPALRAVPVILLTAKADHVVAGLEAGASDYMSKPFAPAELRARVQALLLARERAARAAAEDAERRAAFLAEAGALLSESLDYEETLGRLGRLCVRSLADWCTIDLVEGREIRGVAGAHADPAREPILREVQRRYPPRWDSPQPAVTVLRTGQPLLMPELPDEILRTKLVDDEHLRLARELGTRTGLSVPLVARGQMLGALSLASAAPGRRFGRADLELAQEVARRAASAIDNARLYRASQEAVRARNEFLSVASHELNTPVTSLKLAVQFVRRAARPVDPQTMDKMLEIVLRQVTRLTRLSGDLLDASRMQAGCLPLVLTDVDLGALVREVASRFEADLARSQCSVSISTRDGAPVVGRWDRSRLDQVVTNLLSNAIKFGAGKPIEIVVGEGGGVAQIIVEDHGIGIDPARRGRLFERFERAVSENYGGLGLGLYISRGLVEGHGGSIRCESQHGGGSTFTIELPCAGPP